MFAELNWIMIFEIETSCDFPPPQASFYVKVTSFLHILSLTE